MIIYSLDTLLSQFACSVSGSNCCFLTWIQVSQEAGKVVWYSHLFKNFPKFVVRGSTDQISNIHLIIEKAREFQKNTYFCFVDYTKAFNCVNHNKLNFPAIFLLLISSLFHCNLKTHIYNFSFNVLRCVLLKSLEWDLSY